MASVSSLEEASAALQSAHAEGRRVRIGEDLTADSLTRILEHDPGDQTCTVEAGVRLSDLQTALAASGQRLSLDPPGDPTIGALLAENLSGPLRHRFGTPRDLVLGATLVLGDGTIASSGGKVVKNVAGYDLARLVCGSQGRLAFVARASFRLHPLPRASATVEADTSAWDESRERQGGATGRVPFAPGDLARVVVTLTDAVIRPAAGVAYTRHPSASDNLSQAFSAGPAQALVERIRRQLDPRGVLGG